MIEQIGVILLRQLGDTFRNRPKRFQKGVAGRLVEQQIKIRASAAKCLGSELADERASVPPFARSKKS